MKLQLEATPEEIQERASDIVKALEDIIAEHAPDVADALVKALPQKSPEMHYPALKHLQQQSEALYGSMMAQMIDKIGDVIIRDTKPEPKTDKSMNFDYTKDLIDEQAKLYDRVRTQFYEAGYEHKDFEEGGQFYGWSSNQLIEHLRGRKRAIDA